LIFMAPLPWFHLHIIPMRAVTLENLVFGNTELRKEMGERNREIVVRNYSWLESAKKLKRIYESLL